MNENFQNENVDIYGAYPGDDEYLNVDMKEDGIGFTSFDSVTLNEEWVTILRDKLTAWLNARKSNENALNVDRVTDAIAQANVDNAANTSEDLYERVFYNTSSVCLTIPDSDAKTDCVVFDIGYPDCILITGHEDDDQATVRIAPNTIPTLVMVLSGWYDGYQLRQNGGK